MDLVKKIASLNKTLAKSEIPYAFGGALALAWCTQRARGTIDIDVNIFIGQQNFEIALASLPKSISYTSKDKKLLAKNGQARLWWDKTPIDIFLNNTPLHEEIKSRIQFEEFAGSTMPFLACQDIAIFKAFFNRTKDWADIEDMLAASTIDLKEVRRNLLDYLDKDDERIEKLNALMK